MMIENKIYEISKALAKHGLTLTAYIDGHSCTRVFKFEETPCYVQITEYCLCVWSVEQIVDYILNALRKLTLNGIKVHNYNDADEYQKSAGRFYGGFVVDPTEVKPNLDTPRLIDSVMGLPGECGEFVEIVKKYLYQGREIDYIHAKKELGDVAWYLQNACTALGFNFSDILRTNIEKLEARYPEGHFSQERALHRKEGDI